jgi:hypothetical protein
MGEESQVDSSDGLFRECHQVPGASINIGGQAL